MKLIGLPAQSRHYKGIRDNALTADFVRFKLINGQLDSAINRIYDFTKMTRPRLQINAAGTAQ